MPTLTDIVKELAKPGRDPREQFEVFSFADGVNAITDLKVGMKLSGIITNVTNFGAFVDIGVHQDGLVHMSQLANRFVSNPNDVVKVSQVVCVTVLEVDIARKRISLSMKEESQQVKKSESSKVEGAKDKAQGSSSDVALEKTIFRAQPQSKPTSSIKDVDGDLQDKLAKLKGMFN